LNTVDGGDTDPFNSGDKISYTIQAGDELDDDTYYWRVVGIDPAGGNTFGEWATTRSFTTEGGVIPSFSPTPMIHHVQQSGGLM
jgi:hypothetical protein